MKRGSISARKALAKRLRVWRKSRAIPLKTLAAELGVAKSTAGQWERGDRFPSAENLDALSHYMQQPLCVLFCNGKADCPFDCPT